MLPRSFRRIRHHHFTLIEMMIVMSLLSILAAVTGISIRRAVLDERYRTGVAQLAGRLQTAQDIMLIVRSDVTVLLKLDAEGLTCRMESAQPLLPALQRIIDRPAVIRGISAFTWTPIEGTALTNQPLTLNFKANGTQVSRGEIKISTGDLHSYILITGLAEPIEVLSQSRIEDLQRMAQNDQSLQRLYPNEVRMIIEPFMEQLSRRPSKNDAIEPK